jgi:hypothetical protein
MAVSDSVSYSPEGQPFRCPAAARSGALRLAFWCTAALLLLFWCTGPSHAGQGPQQRLLPGSWVYVSGPTDFEQMAFAIENGRRVFRSWLHERPEHTGQWTLRGKEVVIRIAGTGAFNETFRIVQVTQKRLVVRFRGRKSSAVFRRAKPG